ncbi:hypothetical protein GGF46_004157 [Coemansia sp. RSA 552]|nr:hypothetical protein GGF46_004157 [Coemansia sp. RSA 552]
MTEVAELGERIAALGRSQDYVELGRELEAASSTTLSSVVEGAAGASLALHMLRAAKGAGLAAVAGACVGAMCEADDAAGWSNVGDALLDALREGGARGIVDAAFRVLAEVRTRGAVPVPLATAAVVGPLLDALGAVGRVELVWQGAHVARTGAELKAYWISAACGCRWDARAAARVAAVLREAATDSEDLAATVARRVVRQLAHSDADELPALAYQALLLARHAARDDVATGLLGFFDGPTSPETAPGSAAASANTALANAAATVLVHISYSVRHDFALGDALLAAAKRRLSGSEASAVSSFSAACVLILARIHRFADTAESLLRGAIERGLADRRSLGAVAWARAVLPPLRADPRRLLTLVAARAASSGWDQVTQALVQLGVDQLDHSARVRPAAASSEVRNLAMDTLRSAFAAHGFVRGEIVDQIVSRVIFQAAAHMAFVQLLGLLVEDDGEAMRAYGSKIVGALDSIGVMAPATLEALLRAASPLFVDDAPFRASLVLVLRKVLFAHGIDERRVALPGLFVLIVAAADRVAAAAEDGEAALSVLLDLLGLLRRCLTQLPEIRALAYQKLAVLLDRPSARQCAPLLAALQGIFDAELAKFYQRDGAHAAPLNIHQCVSPASHKIVMPVDCFLLCYTKLALVHGHASSSSSTAVWGDLCLRFAAVHMEDFELDPTGDYSISTPDGLRCHNTARLAIGCLDACLEYSLVSSIRGEAEPEDSTKLFSVFSRFADVLCSRCLDDKRKRLIGLPSDLSRMSLHSAVMVLSLVLPDKQRVADANHPLNATGHDAFVAESKRAGLWAANSSLVKHLLEVALARVTMRVVNIDSITFYEAPELATSAVLRLAYVVYSGIVACYGSAYPTMDLELPAYLSARGGRGRGVAQLGVEVLGACASMLAARQSLDLLVVALLRPSPGLLDSDDPEPVSASIFLQCADLLVAYLRNTVFVLLAQKPVAVKEATGVLAVLRTVCGRVVELSRPMYGAVDGEEDLLRAYQCLRGTAQWTERLIEEVDIPGDVGLLRAIVLLLLDCQQYLQPDSVLMSRGVELSSGGGACPAGNRDSDDAELGVLERLVRSLCSASRLLTGDPGAEEEEDPMDGEEPNMNIFTLRTVPVLVSAIAGWMKSELHVLDWVSGQQLRRTAEMEMASREAGDADDLGASITVERRLCVRMSFLGTMLMQLLSVVLPGTAANDQVIRGFQDLHRSFALLTRAKLGLPDIPVTEAYVDLLSLICTDLNSHAYSTIIEKYGAVSSGAGGASQAYDAKAKGKGKKSERVVSGRAKVMRSSALVSSLVYQMELTEKYVIQLATKMKTPLAHYLKRSTARDFRIEATALHAPVDPQLVEYPEDTEPAPEREASVVLGVSGDEMMVEVSEPGEELGVGVDDESDNQEDEEEDESPRHKRSRRM